MAIATFADDPDQPSWITAFEHTRRQLRQKTDDTWDDIDDDVEYESEQAPLPLGTRYFLAFYWALCTLVGSGSPDVVPVTDSERKYDACIALLSALVFGYVIGEIGRLLASLDRQAMVLEQKMDAVKEFLAWRKVHSPLLSSPSISPTSSLSPLNLQPPTSHLSTSNLQPPTSYLVALCQVPRKLAIRVKRYYEYYFATASAFDEQEVLEPLPPLMHDEVVRFVAADTLLKVPMFTRLDPTIHKHLLRLLKPLSLAYGDEVYRHAAALARTRARQDPCPRLRLVGS